MSKGDCSDAHFPVKGVDGPGAEDGTVPGAIDRSFDGPLFVVGNPRSGTKLLRDLLNRSPHIDLCNPETHFIPYLWGRHGDGSNRFEADLDRLFEDFERIPFQHYAARMGKRCMTRDDFDRLGDCTTWASAFEVICRFYGDASPQAGRDGGEVGAAAERLPVWGDKTPSYVTEMPLLKRIFPAARFVHIIRDPRDVAVSAHRAWGHSRLRVADKWRHLVEAARRDRSRLGDAYIEVHYEDLLADPETVLRRVCDLVERPYLPEMTTLAVPSENIGTARGKRFIDAGNSGRFAAHLSQAKLRRIEEIVFDAIADMPYRPLLATRHRPLVMPERIALRASDGGRTALRLLREKGLREGIRVNLGVLAQKRRSLSRS